MKSNKLYKSPIRFQGVHSTPFGLPHGLILSVDRYTYSCYSDNQEVRKYLYDHIEYSVRWWLQDQKFWRKFEIESKVTGLSQGPYIRRFTFKAFVCFRSEESKLLYDLRWA